MRQGGWKAVATALVFTAALAAWLDWWYLKRKRAHE